VKSFVQFRNYINVILVRLDRKWLLVVCREENILPTTLVVLALSTCLLGCMLIVVSKLRLASVIQYIPMPVIGGYLGCYVSFHLSTQVFNVLTNTGVLSSSIHRVLLRPGWPSYDGRLIYIMMTLQLQARMYVTYSYMRAWNTCNSVGVVGVSTIADWGLFLTFKSVLLLLPGVIIGWSALLTPLLAVFWLVSVCICMNVYVYI
jgi:MFS superfamily sulfate permease-like transporter